MDFKMVAEHLIWTDEGYGNSAAIDLGEKVFVIDSMFNWELAKEWRSNIVQHFGKPVSGLILTHHHADHTFGNQVFSDLPIISSLEIRKITEEFEKEVWENETQEDRDEWEAGGYGVKNLQLTHSSLCFEKKLLLFGERKLELIQADGHTSGSTYLWEPETRTLIVGDLVFNKEFPYGGDATCNVVKWQEVIEDLIALEPEIIISGHGPAATVKDLEEINDFLSKSIDFVREKIVEGVTLKEIEADPHFPEYYSQDRTERKKITIERWVRFFKE
ncbi:MAG: MBL fold metallo-hydrolase [Candidatus Heimdallarchaeota archaeon]|nr:MAG: MBL fold metallo-hydrolase [Candidatus Heimdallarchaeota archaeon]